MMIRAWAIRLSWLAAFLAALFAAYTAVLYTRAGKPDVTPRPAAAHVDPLPSTDKQPADPGNYAALAGGRIFFGEPSAPAFSEESASTPVYVSALMVRGIILGNGQPPMAILTRAGAPPDGESWTVRVGQTVLGEQVAAINNDRVVLRKDGMKTVLILAK